MEQLVSERRLWVGVNLSPGRCLSWGAASPCPMALPEVIFLGAVGQAGMGVDNHTCSPASRSSYLHSARCRGLLLHLNV